MLTHPEFSFVVQGSVSSLQSTSVHLNNQGLDREGRILGGGGIAIGAAPPPPHLPRDPSTSLQSTSVHLNNQGIGREGRTLGGGGVLQLGPGQPPPLCTHHISYFAPTPTKLLLQLVFLFVFNFLQTNIVKLFAVFGK